MNEEELNKKTKKNTVRVVPASQIELGKVALAVSLKWRQSNWLTLQWKDSITFEKEVEMYQASLASRLVEGGTRPQITKALKILDAKIDNSLMYVKNYILERYKKEASKSYYAAFGFKYKNNAYIFPQDQTNRVVSLKAMVNALSVHEFADKEYGTTFWKECLNEYEELLDAASKTDGFVSLKVGDNRILKIEITKVLNALVWVLKGNFPDTYKEELRSWGFQKEKY